MDREIDTRNFRLSPAFGFGTMPSFGKTSPRPILHRTYNLSVDASENLGLYRKRNRGTCFIALDKTRTAALQIPVFFVGRPDEPVADLLADARRFRFDGSENLEDGGEFSNVQFRLSRGGRSFNRIQPFFRCGLPGLLVCSGSCPDDSIALAASLVKSAITKRPPPVSEAEAQNRNGRDVNVGPDTRQIRLDFKTENGSALASADVLQAEGALTFANAVFTSEGGTLTGSVPSAEVPALQDIARLQQSFHYHRIVSSSLNGDTVTVTVSPQYVRADDVKIDITGSGGQPAPGCMIGLDVPQARRLGTGWSKIKEAEGKKLLVYRSAAGGGYRLSAPPLAGNEVLIDVAEAGAGASLTNPGGGCVLEGAADVSNAEVRSLSVKRTLRKSGPIFIAMVTTDSAMATLLPSSTEGYWKAALDLIAAAASKTFERKILARPQAPLAASTKILRNAGEEAIFNSPAVRDTVLGELIEGSKPNNGPASVSPLEPISRRHLDGALNAIRTQGRIFPTQSSGVETLLLVSGGVKSAPANFCRETIKEEIGTHRLPLWVTQLRRAVVIEIWDEGARAEMLQNADAESIDGAPGRVSRCSPVKMRQDKIAVYGIPALSVANDDTRRETFAFLTVEAAKFLNPAP